VDRKSRLREVNTAAAAYFHFLLTKTERGKTGYAYYREKRHFTDETIARFGLGYADIYADDLYRYLKQKGFSDEVMRDTGLVDFSERNGPQDKFWNRVMVPILDMQGKCIAFGGRVLGDGKPKYLNTRETEIFDKSRNLFALNIARRSRRRGIILCEGYMDVITQHQAGFDNAVASLGTAFTEGQAAMIRRFTKEVYLAYDGDTAGKMAAKKAIRMLRSMDMSQRVIDLSPYKDPDEFLSAEGPEAYEERIGKAVPGRLFEIREMAKEYHLSDPEEKSTFIREAAVSIAGIQDIPERSSYIETVSREFGLDENVLQQEVSRIGMLGLEERTAIRNEEEYQPRTVSQGNAPAARTAEQSLLAWMVGLPEYFGKLKEYISPEDFTGRCREIAEELFRQYESEGRIEPKRILSRYPDEDSQKEVAHILSDEFPFDADKESTEKALTEIVRKVKLEGEDRAMQNREGGWIEHAKRKAMWQKLTIRL
ncbi:MAG: DNA primase, partial [Eubacterium sp.]|nr:DNA primase [Eubacterium sp.]